MTDRESYKKGGDSIFALVSAAGDMGGDIASKELYQVLNWGTRVLSGPPSLEETGLTSDMLDWPRKKS